jgi:NADPH:quinone reductase
MKAIQVKQFGGPEQMKLVELEHLVPGPGEVLVEVRAIGVNPVDTYIRAGLYPVLPQLPYTPGKDVAGVIAAVGSGVDGWIPGDRVYTSGTLSGGYASKALCTIDQVFKLPESVSFKAGASVGIPGATAWRALFMRGGGKAGDKVFIHGASGSVGLAAVQLAKVKGMEVHGTAGTAKGMRMVKDLGADYVYDYRQVDYLKYVMEKSGSGVDLILEMLANKNLENDLTLLAPKGRVVIIGSQGRIEIDPRLTMGKDTEIRGMSLFNCSQEEMAEIQAGLAELLESKRYVPQISQSIKLEDAALAHERVMGSGNCGKIVLIP